MMCKRLCFHLKNKFELLPQIHFGVFQMQINQSASRLSCARLKSNEVFATTFYLVARQLVVEFLHESLRLGCLIESLIEFINYQNVFLLSNSHFSITQHACIICRKGAFDELSSRTFNLSTKCQKKHLNYGFFSPLFFITK